MDPSRHRPAPDEGADESGTESEPPPVPPDAGALEDDCALAVEIVHADGDWSALADAGTLAAAATAALARAPQIAGSLPAAACIAFSNDAGLRALNRAWRTKDKPTNVLSFPAGGPSPPGAPRFLGDVVLAGETVLREAADLGIPPAHHLQHLVVHGLLHLFGCDHETDAEAEAMEAIETAVLATLGIPDPYARDD